MAKRRTLLDNMFLFFKGLAMGAANKVPGVSGATVSFVLGFYEELIYSFQKINIKALGLLINGRFKSFWRYVNASFLMFIFSGSIFSYFSVSLLLDYLIKNYKLLVWSWFFGMIIGSIYYVAKDVKKWSFSILISSLIGTALGISISFLNPASENHDLGFVFLCGIIGVSGMVLPGLSGSFILIILGNYVLLLVDSVNALFKTIVSTISADWSVYKDPQNLNYLKIISVFTLGSAFGLVVTSHIIGYVLKRWHQIVLGLILGFITGSLGNVWPWKKAVYFKINGQVQIDSNGDEIIRNYKRFLPSLMEYETWIAVFFILFGTGVIVWFDYYGKHKKNIA